MLVLAQSLDIRMSKDQLEVLKTQANREKKTANTFVLDVIEDIITGKTKNKDIQIQILQKNQDLEHRLDKEYGKTMPKKDEYL